MFHIFSCKSYSRIANVRLSVHQSVHQSVTKTPQPLRIAPIDHWSDQPLSLSTIKPIDQQAYRPLSLLTIEPIDHWAYRPSSLSNIKSIDYRAYWPLYLSAIWPAFATSKPFRLVFQIKGVKSFTTDNVITSIQNANNYLFWWTFLTWFFTLKRCFDWNVQILQLYWVCNPSEWNIFMCLDR